VACILAPTNAVAVDSEEENPSPSTLPPHPGRIVTSALRKAHMLAGLKNDDLVQLVIEENCRKEGYVSEQCAPIFDRKMKKKKEMEEQKQMMDKVQAMAAGEGDNANEEMSISVDQTDDVSNTSRNRKSSDKGSNNDDIRDNGDDEWVVSSESDFDDVPQLDYKEQSPADMAATLDEHGRASVLFEEIGPIVITKDGEMRRISNWSELSSAEKAQTQRVVSRRNRKRLEKLQAALRQEEENEMAGIANAKKEEDTVNHNAGSSNGEEASIHDEL